LSLTTRGWRPCVVGWVEGLGLGQGEKRRMME
jgi:hypothetical protein